MNFDIRWQHTGPPGPQGIQRQFPIHNGIGRPRSRALAPACLKGEPTMAPEVTPPLPSVQLPPSITLAVEEMAIDRLAPLSRKLRIHKKATIASMAAAIRQFGFLVPVLINAEDKIVSGNGRLEAARTLGMQTVPCIRISHLDDNALRVFAIAENQLGQLAGWDSETLKIELQELSQVDLGFSLELTGFSSARIDSLILGGDTASGDGDRIPEVQQEPVSRLGDLWVLGDQRLYCGDATAQASFETLMGGERARVVITDPPYNVAIDGHVTGGGKHGEFVMASGEMSDEEFTAFLTQVLARISDCLIEGGLAYFAMDWRHAFHTLKAAEATGFELLNLIVWDKTAGGMGSFYRSRHELFFLFRKPGASHLNRVELGAHGRNRANVWTYEGVNGFGAAKAKAREMHPTVKPLALIRDAILDSTARGDVVLDLFSGSGTTLIAAEQSRRRGRATELDPRYVDVGVIRWQEFTGQEARLAATGQTFREVRAERRASNVVSMQPPPEPQAAGAPPPARVRHRTRLAA